MHNLSKWDKIYIIIDSIFSFIYDAYIRILTNAICKLPDWMVVNSWTLWIPSNSIVVYAATIDGKPCTNKVQFLINAYLDLDDYTIPLDVLSAIIGNELSIEFLIMPILEAPFRYIKNAHSITILHKENTICYNLDSLDSPGDKSLGLTRDILFGEIKLKKSE